MENRLPPPMPEGAVVKTTPPKKQPLTNWREQEQKPAVPIDWVVEKMLTAGDTTALVSDGGLGKSWKAAHIAMQVANGEPVDGMFKTKQGNVLWFDNENGQDETDRRCKILDRGQLRKSPRWQMCNVFFNTNHWTADDDGIALLHEYINEVAPVLVIFDSLVSVLPGGSSENDAAEMRSILDKISQAMRCNADGTPREMKPAALILHHTKKGTEEGAWPEPRGSGDIKNACTFLMVMRPNIFMRKDGTEEKRVQFRWVKSRRGKMDDNLYEYALVDHGVPDTAEHWVEYVSHGKASNFTEYLEGKILLAFQEGEELSGKQIGERVEHMPEQKNRRNEVLALMVGKGLLRAEQGKSYKDGYIYSKVSKKMEFKIDRPDDE